VSQKRLTTEGSPIGTPAFMPPEQALALWDQVDARSDVYSLGASMFTLLTGQLVHDGRTVAELMVHISTKPARPIRSVLELVPPPIAAVIDRALLSARELRFDDAGAMLKALRQAGVDMLAQRHGRMTLASGGNAFDGDATVRAEPAPPAAAAVSAAFAPTGTLHAGRAPARDTARPVSSDPRRVPKAGVGVLLAGLAMLGGVGGYLAYRSTTSPGEGADGASETASETEAAPAPAQATADSAPSARPSAAPRVDTTSTGSAVSSTQSPAPSAQPVTSPSGLSTAVAPLKTSRPTEKPSAKPSSTSTAPCQRDPFSMQCKR
jgi:serine/threonine-protein kinase